MRNYIQRTENIRTLTYWDSITQKEKKKSSNLNKKDIRHILSCRS